MNAHTKAILDQLDAHYGREYICYLNHENAWQLLIATMLSAQCTDARVNIVTKDLFVKYPSVEAFAEADLKELEQDIRPTGFYHNKAKNIIACCQRLMALHGGEVSSGLEELTALPERLDDYEEIYLGYPNYCGTMPMAVYTFLEHYDWQGKTIHPFCTNEGSGLSNTEQDIRRAAKGAQVARGLSLRGSAVEGAKPKLEQWVRG